MRYAQLDPLIELSIERKIRITGEIVSLILKLDYHIVKRVV